MAIKRRDRERLPPAVDDFKKAKLPDDDMDLEKAERLLREFQARDGESQEGGWEFETYLLVRLDKGEHMQLTICNSRNMRDGMSVSILSLPIGKSRNERESPKCIHQ